MTWRLTGPANADLNEIRNFMHEKGAALPGPYNVAWEGRAFFVTTAGVNYGLWVGGAAAWERPTLAGGVAIYYVGTSPGDFPTTYDALVDAAANSNAKDVWIFVRDSQDFSPLVGDQVALSEKNIHICGLPHTVEGRPVLTFLNTAPPTISLQRGYITFQDIRVRLNAAFASLDNVLIDVLGAQDVWLWNADLEGTAIATGSILGVGADGSDATHNVMVYSFASSFSHAGSGQAIYHKTPAATKTNTLTVWSFGSVWDAQAVANGSTDGTTTQFLVLHAMHGSVISNANSINSLGRKLADVVLSADYATYVAQGPTVTATKLGTDVKVDGTYVPANYAVPPTPSVYDHLQGIDAKLGAIGGVPRPVYVPMLGTYVDLFAALVAIGAAMPPPTHPAISIDYAEELGVGNVLPPPLGGARIAQEGRVIGGIAAVEAVGPQDLFLHGNGKDNCVRSAVIIGSNAATRKVLSITCMGIRDDNFLVPGDAGSPYFPAGVQIIGQGLFEFRLHCDEVRRPIDISALDPALGWLSLNWQFTKFYVPVEDIILKAGENQTINGCEFFMPVEFAATDAPTNVSVDRCNFFSTPSVLDPNITLLVTDSWIEGRYYSWAKITSAGIVEAHIGLPMLTTAQRIAMVPLLGCMVYDTTINEPFYWDGAFWVSMKSSAGALPLNIFAIPGGTDLATLVLADDSVYWLTQASYNVLANWAVNKRIRLMGNGKTETGIFTAAGVVITVSGGGVVWRDFTLNTPDPTVTPVLVSGTDFSGEDIRITGAGDYMLELQGANPLLDNAFIENFSLTSSGAVFVNGAASEAVLHNSRFDAQCSGAGIPVVRIDAAGTRFEHNKVNLTGPTGKGVLVNVPAVRSKVSENTFIITATAVGAVWSDTQQVEIIDNEITGPDLVPAIQSSGLSPHIGGNQINATATIYAIVINGQGNGGRIHDNYVGMDDLAFNIGIDLVGLNNDGLVVANNTMYCIAGTTPFVNAFGISTAAAYGRCVVVGNIFGRAIGGAGFALTSEVAHNVLV